MRTFPFMAGVSLLIASLAPVEVSANEQKDSSGNRPNIVWIMSEDNSIHYLNHFFPSGAETPAIKGLAAEGVTFINAYSNAPVCSVARTTLITGCYAPRLGTQYHRRNQVIQLPPEIKLFPAYLRSAGYYTTNNSKEDYNATGNKEAWNESSRKASWKNRPTPETPFFHVQTFTDSHESSLHFDQQTFQQTKTTHDPASVSVHPYLPDTPLVRYTHARYLDRIQQIDGRVTEVIEQLKADQLWDNTIVFYFGDHGGVLPRSKGYAYDTGTHVPLVVRIPKQYQKKWSIKHGTRDSRFVEFVDFGPTVLSMAGVSIPKSLDGDPFLASDVSDGTKFESALTYADRFDEKYDLVRSLHKGRFHYIRNYQPFYPDSLYNEYRYKMLAYSQWKELQRQQQVTPEQSAFFESRPAEMLFDLAVDPFEVNNLARDPEYAETLIQLRTELQQKLKGLPDLSFLTEPVAVPGAAKNPLDYAVAQKARIGNLIDIADTCLSTSDEHQQLLSSAIKSTDPLERFWAATSLATFASSNDLKLSSSIYNEGRELLTDKDPMVRARAAEAYLVLSGIDPSTTLVECLNESRSELETLWILNAVVFADDMYGDDRETKWDQLKLGHQGGEISRRTSYLKSNSH